MNAINFSWQSTPQLWMATFDDYDGGMVDYDTPSRDPMGFGTTQEEATRDLFDMDEGHHERRMHTPAEDALVEFCGDRRKA